MTLDGVDDDVFASVSTQVWVSCGEPSGMSVVKKQGLGARNNVSSPSGSVMSRRRAVGHQCCS